MKALPLALFASLVSTTAYAGGYVAPEIIVDPVQVITAPAAPAPSWTGFYAGLQIGGGEAELSFSDVTGSEDIDAFGFHLGYMRDLGRFIVGGEFVYDRVSFDSVDDSEGNLGRFQGRLGYNGGRFMPYVTLGIAAVTNDDDDISESGYIVGIGAEYLLTNRFSLGAEYTRSSFSDVLEDELGTSDVDLDADLFQLRASYRF